ncbi:putative chemoreceptor glutamine deamidase CheD 1 [Candidatus Zixiibacteriota bacterium]|nr:putative chemoreceptor glutamine deamidase CheD 1 [candidate division Zixibacteria bacterium]
MSLIVVGISDIQVSSNPGDVLITYSLGSCIGLTAYDPIAKVGGMIHYMLPLSKISPEKAEAKPGMFADTGVPLLLKGIIARGAAKSRLIVKAAGGSQLMDQNKVFNIGERNFLILRKILWKNNILINSSDVGGMLSRTMRFELDTGLVTIKSSHGENEL